MRNRPEFHVADVAVMLCGATPISIYNSSAPDQIEYLAGHCNAVAAIVEDGAYLDRFMSVRAALPALRHVAVIEEPPGGLPEGVLGWDDLLSHAPVDLDAAGGVAKPSDLATVIYTSGTTGPPKGVMLDHANIVWTVECYQATVAVRAGMACRLVPADGAHRGTHDLALPRYRVGVRGDDVPRPGPGRAVPRIGPAPDVLRGAARVGEGVREPARRGRGRPCEGGGVRTRARHRLGGVGAPRPW